MFHYDLRENPCWRPSIKGEQFDDFTNINMCLILNAMKETKSKSNIKDFDVLI